MAKAVEQFGSGLTVGHAALGVRGTGRGSVRQQVYDGDTLTVAAVGNFGVRLLGVDAPELAIPLPPEGRFVKLSEPAWKDFLGDPFAEDLPPFDPPLDAGLLEYLRTRTGEGAAENHYRHGLAAEDALEAEILADLEALGQSEEDFRFFLTFGYEVMDRYGRFLCYVNREQPDADKPAPRPRSYNERLLAAGAVAPYFIWPNVDPFAKRPSVVDAVPEPGFVAAFAEDGSLGVARRSVREARGKKIGIFGEEPLRVSPFEVRYLARRRPPDRWVLDLTSTDGVLLPPQRYYEIPNEEDRLFVPEEYVPLFVEAGWSRAE